MEILRFTPHEMHVLVVFSSLKEVQPEALERLFQYSKKDIDALRIEARSMVYLLAGLDEQSARDRVGCTSDKLWGVIMSVYRELEPMAEARRQSSKRRAEELARRRKFGFCPVHPYIPSYQNLGIQ